MDDKVKKRIYALNFGGVINAFFGLYILIERPAVLDPQMALWIAFAFLAFALIDFLMAIYLKRGWEAKERAAQGSGDSPVRRS